MDGGAIPEGGNLTLEGLAKQFISFQEAARRSQAELTALKDEIAQLKGAVPQSEAPNAVESSDVASLPPNGNGPVSRRGALLALGGAAAGAAGMAVGSAILGAEPAAAANPNFILDQSNTGTATTTLTGDVGTPVLFITNTGTDSSGGSAVYAVYQDESDITGANVIAAVVGDTSEGIGVLGLSRADNAAVCGVSSGFSGLGNGGPLSGVPIGSLGDTASTGFGVVGLSSGGNGVFGVAQSFSTLPSEYFALQNGVVGESGAPHGNGVLGLSSNGSGVLGLAGGPSGIAPPSTQVGVFGDSNAGTGVAGTSSSGTGVSGTTTADNQIGVQGIDSSPGGGTAVSGQSTNGTGVSGSGPLGGSFTGSSGAGAIGNGFVGLVGETNATETTGLIPPAGVLGSGNAFAPGVVGYNSSGPTLGLFPYTSTTLPTTCLPGQFIVLSDGSLHYCQTANEWIALGAGGSSAPSIVTIDPIRVINTDVGTGGITGPLTPGSTVYTSDAIAGTNGIPLDATAIVGNFAISGVNGALLNGYGVATIFPAGGTTPATASINSGAGCFAIANAVTVGFGTGANAGKLSIIWGGGGPVPQAEAFLDVTGYIV